MLTKKNILIIGGDTRYVEIIKQLSAEEANVFIVGFEQLNFTSTNVYNIALNEVDFENLDALLLPVSGTDDAGKVSMTFSEKNDIYITEEMLLKTPDHCIIYTGTTNPFLTNLTKICNKQLLCLFDRDDLAIINSIPTAEGTLQIAMEETERTIHGANIIVLGFGRVGLTVARLFSSVGANVHVCARSSTAIARIIEMGLTPVKMYELKQSITSMDICINTIPHLIINKNILSAMDQETLIIDLASAPGGTDFDTAKEKNIKALHALGLPGKVAPKSAGDILAQIVIQLIKEQQ